MGSKKSSSVPAPAPEPKPLPTPLETANAQMEAYNANIPKAAALDWQTKTDPTYGMKAQTQLGEDVRQQVFPHEQQIREQLLSNVLANLISPTGISPQQQSAIDTRRGTAQSELVSAMRNRQNLGGKLFGGHGIQEEGRAVGELQGGFATEDINRDQTARLNAINAALPVLQLLFPEIGLQNPSFINPVASPEASLQANLSGRGQDMNYYSANRGQDLTYQSQMDANKKALQSALYQSIGSVLGSKVSSAGTGGTGGAGGCWVASEIFGGWYHPKTCMARYFINNIAPKWFKDFYINNGENIAKFISDKPILKIILRPLFEIFVLVGEYKCQTIFRLV